MSEEITELTQNNALVHTLYATGGQEGWSYEKFLEQCVLALARVNESKLAAFLRLEQFKASAR